MTSLWIKLQICVPSDHLNITKCYLCDSIRNPKDCHNTVDCHPNEICSVGAEVVVGGSGPFISYDLGCKQRTICKGLPTIQYRLVSLTSKCCNTTLCNDHYLDEIPTTVTSTTVINTMTDVCRNHPDVDCAYLMSINMCTAPVADRYCVEPCYNCIKTGQIPTRDPNTILG
ncbi:uncharacterized protein LOC143058078 [Mytilus galloprovincialis]|uniref:uncharacterized protein LOC143058078 n=1 Tax=Mytilus galloprovincialis TaxID=29158 RepID=UPI003F7CBB5A